MIHVKNNLIVNLLIIFRSDFFKKQKTKQNKNFEITYYIIPQCKHQCCVPSVSLIVTTEIHFFISENSLKFPNMSRRFWKQYV